MDVECTPYNGQVVKQLLPMGCKYEMKEEAKQNIKKFVERGYTHLLLS